MSETQNRKPDAEQPEPKTRKPYHTPRMDDYGKVNELTRSGVFFSGGDGPFSYTST